MVQHCDIGSVFLLLSLLSSQVDVVCWRVLQIHFAFSVVKVFGFLNVIFSILVIFEEN